MGNPLMGKSPPATEPERERMMRCGLAGDLRTRRCHVASDAGATCGTGACNIKGHYCGCKWQTWERVVDDV